MCVLTRSNLATDHVAAARATLAERERALRDVTASLAASLDDARTLEIATRSAARLLQAPYARIWLVDERGALNPGVTFAAGTPARLDRLPRESVVGLVVQSGRPVVLAQVATHPVWRDTRFSERSGLCAYLGVPVQRAGVNLAVLEVMRALPFNPDDADILLGLASAAAVAIANARTLADMQALTAVVASTPDAVIAYDLDGVIRGWNAGAERLYGWTRDEMVGGRLHVLTPDERLDELAAQFERLRRGEHVQDHETVRVRKDGQRIDISVSLAPIRDAAGRVVGAGGISRDITQRKRVEAMLRRREQEFAALVAHAPDAIARIDRDARFSYVNPAMERLTGMPAQRIHGKTIADLGASDAVASAWTICVSQVFASAREVTTELTLPTPNGERNLQARLAPELASDGQVEYVLCVARDITERTRADEERGALYRELLDHQRRLHQLTEQVLLRQQNDVKLPPQPARPSLTPRELAVLQLLVRGYSNPAIGRELHVSAATVKTHVAAVLTKLEVADRTQAAVRAVALGLARATQN